MLLQCLCWSRQHCLATRITPTASPTTAGKRRCFYKCLWGPSPRWRSRHDALQPAQDLSPVLPLLVKHALTYLRVAGERVDQLAIAGLPDLHCLIRGCHKTHAHTQRKQQRAAILFILTYWQIGRHTHATGVLVKKEQHLTMHAAAYNTQKRAR